jgi:heat-inducible transcriptional repressor
MAYRLYVDTLMEKVELPEEERRIISEKLAENISELDTTIEHAANILSEITNLTAFAITPKEDDSRVSYINVLPADHETVVIMIAAESGKIKNTVVKLKSPCTEESLSLLSKSLTYNYRGRTISDILTMDIIRNFETDVEAMGRLAKDIMPTFMRALESMLDIRLYLDGLTNIFSIPEYSNIERAKMFIEMINKKKNFTDVLINRDDGVIITIGNENKYEMMNDCSLITATYHINGKQVGKLGVIGPTRMDYDKVTSVIEYMTDNISKAFKFT